MCWCPSTLGVNNVFCLVEVVPLVWRVQPRVSLESAWLIATVNVSPSSGQIFKSHVGLINKADAQNIFHRFTFVDLKPVKICVPVHWVCAQQCVEWPEVLVAHDGMLNTASECGLFDRCSGLIGHFFLHEMKNKHLMQRKGPRGGGFTEPIPVVLQHAKVRSDIGERTRTLLTTGTCGNGALTTSMLTIRIQQGVFHDEEAGRL